MRKTARKWNGELLSLVITGLLVLLFVYTAVSKLASWETFAYQMSKQPLPSWLNGLLVWALPVVELITAILLLVRPTRKGAMVLSFLLMLCFTVYVGLAVFDFFDEVPCSCGGVLQSLNWEEHLVFNLIFLGLAGVGWWGQGE